MSPKLNTSHTRLFYRSLHQLLKEFELAYNLGPVLSRSQRNSLKAQFKKIVNQNNVDRTFENDHNDAGSTRPR